MSFLKATEALQKAVNNVFGISVTYTTFGSGLVTTIKGVFDSAFTDVMGVTSNLPRLSIKLSDLAAEPTEGDTILIGTTTYMVTEHEPDGHGTTTLLLRKT